MKSDEAAVVFLGGQMETGCIHIGSRYHFHVGEGHHGDDSKVRQYCTDCKLKAKV